MFGVRQSTRSLRRAWTVVCFSLFVCCDLSGGVSLWPGRARADFPLLSWSAPPECPDAEVVRQRIAAWLGRPDVDAPAAAAAVRASAVVTRDRKGGYKLVLTVSEGAVSGTRRVSDQDCRRLSDTAAFLIAVATDPNAAAAAQPPPPTDEAPGPSESESVTPPAPPSAPVQPPAAPPKPALTIAPARARPWSIHGGGIGGVWGIWGDKLPNLQALAGASVGAAYGIWQAEFRGAYAFGPERPIPSASGRGTARFSTQAYGLAACGLWQLAPRLRAGPCAALTLLTTQAESQGVMQGHSTHKLWSLFGLGAQAAVELVRHLELFGEAGATVPLRDRPAFVIDTSTVLTAAPIAYYGWLGARFRWGLPP